MKSEALTTANVSKNTAIIMSTTSNSNNNLDQTSLNNSNKMINILDEFTKLYSDKLKRIDDDASIDGLQNKVGVLESWVEDLGEQNHVLVSTVEELEKEARSRVSLLQEKLEKMAVATKESCVSLREHQNQMSSLISQKIFAEDEATRLKECLLDSDRTNEKLMQENADLKDDLDAILQVVTGIRLTGRYQETSLLHFKYIKRERVFGTGSSLCLQDLNERYSADGGKSRHDSFSSYGSHSTESDDEMSLTRLRAEVKTLRQKNKENNSLLLQRDEHTAELQSQLTELHHQLSVSQTEVDNATSALETLRDRGRQNTFEICRRDDVIRQLLSPSRTSKEDFKNKREVELQLSDNIDVMAARLVESQDECQQLRHQNLVLKAAHAHCASTINQLQDQLNNSHMSLEDLRSVLTTEVAERHDTSLGLKSRISELRQQHLEEAEKKNQMIENLHEEVRILTKNPEKIIKINQSVQTEFDSASVPEEDRWLGNTKTMNLNLQMSRLENEISEKNILLRELQNLLATSRQELFLKDETLFNCEQKLDGVRREYDEKEERMMYLTSQLTNLQLEVSKLHGTAQQLQLQLENKCKLVRKLETENESLCWQLNEKSVVVEKLQKDFNFYDKEVRKKKREIVEQKMTISTLQDALVSTKQTCDQLRQRCEQENGAKICSRCRINDRNSKELQEQLEATKMQQKLLLEKCLQMENCHEEEFASFVRRLTSVHEDRLNLLQNSLCTCGINTESQILELKLVIDDLSTSLRRATQFVTEDEKRQQSRNFFKETSNNRLLGLETHRDISKKLAREHKLLRKQCLAKSCSLNHIPVKSGSLAHSRSTCTVGSPFWSPNSDYLHPQQRDLEYCSNSAYSRRIEKNADKSPLPQDRSENTPTPGDLYNETKVLLSSVRSWLDQKKIFNEEEEKYPHHETEYERMSECGRLRRGTQRDSTSECSTRDKISQEKIREFPSLNGANYSTRNSHLLTNTQMKNGEEIV